MKEAASFVARREKVRVAKLRRQKREQARRYRDAHRETYNQIAQTWRDQNSEAVASYQQAWRAVNKDRLRAWRRANRPRLRALQRTWSRANPQSAKVSGARRRARALKAGGHASREQVAARVAYYGHVCAYCGGPFEHLEHAIALARGGTNWPANLRPSCQRCNLSKGTRSAFEFRTRPQ